MEICVGIDWGECEHAALVMDRAGKTLRTLKVSDSITDLERLHSVFAEFADDPSEVAIGIETDRGLLVMSLVAAGYGVYAINPKAASRYRDRHSVSGAKSDPSDAKMLADVVRTDRHNHQLVADDSPLAEGIKVLARAHQSLIWSRQRVANQQRSMLREFYPAALAAFGSDGLNHMDAAAVLAAAPTPALGRHLSLSKIRAVLKRGGRQRYLDVTAERIRQALRQPHPEQPTAVADAYGAAVAAQAAVIATYNRQIDELNDKLETHFEQHPDAEILHSLPGLGVVLGARVLGEFGDDPNRYKTAKARKNYAGTSPLTVTSGKKRIV